MDPTEVVDLCEDDEEEDLNPTPPAFFTFERRGQPKPMERPRKYRNHWNSPSKTFIQEMRRAMVEARPTNEVMFPAGVPVSVSICFDMRRPNSHFKRDNRWETNLTKFAKEQTVQPYGADIDNLAKFVLDAMNKTIYHDDSQVVSLSLTKRMHSRATASLCQDIISDKAGSHGVVHVHGARCCLMPARSRSSCRMSQYLGSR